MFGSYLGGQSESLFLLIEQLSPFTFVHMIAAFGLKVFLLFHSYVYFSIFAMLLSLQDVYLERLHFHSSGCLSTYKFLMPLALYFLILLSDLSVFVQHPLTPTPCLHGNKPLCSFSSFTSPISSFIIYLYHWHYTLPQFTTFVHQPLILIFTLVLVSDEHLYVLNKHNSTFAEGFPVITYLEEAHPRVDSSRSANEPRSPDTLMCWELFLIALLFEGHLAEYKILSSHIINSLPKLFSFKYCSIFAFLCVLILKSLTPIQYFAFINFLFFLKDQRILSWKFVFLGYVSVFIILG